MQHSLYEETKRGLDYFQATLFQAGRDNAVNHQGETCASEGLKQSGKIL